MDETSTQPVAGNLVILSFWDATHKVHRVAAHIHSVGQVDESGHPNITAAFPDPNSPVGILGSANWQRGYARLTGILHVSHPEVKAGRTSAAWEYALPEVGDDEAEIPAPGPLPENPVFARTIAPDPVPAVAPPAAAQAAVETGEVPAGPPLPAAEEDEPAPTPPAAPAPPAAEGDPVVPEPPAA
jgi:hypothetical protein